MNDIICIAGLQRLSLPELRRLEAELARRAGATAHGSPQQRRLLADLALVRREIAVRLVRGLKPGP
jgi:hypothetical protein